MLAFTKRVDEIDSTQELQIMDRGYGQIETYTFGIQRFKDFLTPSEIHTLYLQTNLNEVDKYLKSLRQSASNGS